jgi:hypothetical protein
MTIVKFWNAFKPGEILSKDALDSNIGKTLPIVNLITGEEGTGTIIAVEVGDNGFEVTYETDMNFNIRMDDFSVEEPG